MNNDEGFFDQLRKQHSSMPASKNHGGSNNHSLFDDACATGASATGNSADENDSISKTLHSQDTQYQSLANPPESGGPGQHSEQSEPESVGNVQGNEPASENKVHDKSGMPPESRRALVSLLRQGVILSAQKSSLFESICRYQVDIRRHLSDMYLKLVLDEKSGVAFVASVDEEDTCSSAFSVGNDSEEESVSLISRRTLSLFDTLLLLVLRKHYQERETSGEQKVVIDVERLESNLTPFLPLTNSSKSDRKKLNAALQKMVAKRILSSVRGSDDRFEITPIIRYVVNAEFLESMLVEYQRLGSEAGVTADAPGEQEVR